MKAAGHQVPPRRHRAVPSAELSPPPPLAPQALALNFNGNCFEFDSLFKFPFPVIYIYYSFAKEGRRKKEILSKIVPLERISLALKQDDRAIRVISTSGRRRRRRRNKKRDIDKYVLLRRRIPRDSEASEGKIRENRHHRGITSVK